MTDYSSVKVPEDLVNEIKRFIKENKEIGYRSHTEFVIDATRRHLLDLKKFKEATKD